MAFVLIKNPLFILSNDKRAFFYYYYICLPQLFHSSSAYHGHVTKVLASGAWFVHKPDQGGL